MVTKILMKLSSNVLKLFFNIGNMGSKIEPNFKFRNLFSQQTNILSKRAIFPNWVQNFYASFYKNLFKHIKDILLSDDSKEEEDKQKQEPKSQEKPQKLPQAPGPKPPGRPPVVPPMVPTLAHHQHSHDLHTQESQVFNQFPNPFIPRPDQLLAADLAHIPQASDLHSGSYK